MRVPYLEGKVKTPHPALGSGLVRYRPIMAVRVAGPGGSWILDALLDTGSDETIFPEWVSAVLGLDVTAAESREIILAGRAKPLQCRYLPVQLRITDGKQETYEWDAIVGFVAVPVKYPLLGQAGFLQHLDVNFQGADHFAELIPNWAFPGKRT